jgi:hypothetical protein
MNLRIAITLRGGSLKKLRARASRNLKQIDSPVRPNLQGLRPKPGIVGRAGRRSKVKNVIDPVNLQRRADVVLKKGKPWVLVEFNQIARIPGRIVVHANHAVAVGNQCLAKVGAEKAGSTAHQYMFSSQQSQPPSLWILLWISERLHSGC